MTEAVPGSATAGAAPTPQDAVAARLPTAPSPAVPAPPGRLAGSPGGDDGPHTGDGPVDEALGRLRGIEEHDLRTQAATFEDVHGALQDRLADAEG